MAEVDVSSYPKATMPVSPLDVAGKLGGLQQQNQQIQSGAIQIDKQKLDLVTQQFGIMNNELAGLANGNYTKEQAAGRLNTIAKTLNLPPPVVQHMTDELNASPDVKTFAKTAITRGMQTMEKVQQLYGQNATIQDNKTIYGGVQQSPMQGGGFQTVNKAPLQLPVGTPGFNENNEQVFEQPAGPSGVVPAARPAPAARAMPVAPLAPTTTGPTGPTVETTGAPGSPPATFAERTDAAFPKPLKAGPSPLFPEGKEAYSKDQLSASGRAQSIKPAIQALKLMPGLSSGPGTGQFNDLVAAAKAWGIVDTKAENDPTVLRQEIEKKLAQYVGSSDIGKRSDAAQTLAEAGSPNPKKQIMPALQALTRDAIALDRVNILKPQAFKGSDYQNYIKHQGTFPQNIDEKALTLDMLPEKERNSLVTKMAKQYRDGDAGQKQIANKFLTTLQLAKEHGIYEGM